MKITKIQKVFFLIVFISVVAFGIYYFYPNKYIIAMNKQVDWLVELQTSDGAIRDSKSPSGYEPLRYKITPYYASIAATAITYGTGKDEIVRKYIEWYFSHLNWPDRNEINGVKLYGTICDYYVDASGKEMPTNDYDSADAYAATFLSLLRRYYETSDDISIFEENEIKIDEIGKTIIALIDKDGLTFAKPDYKIKFLMDNCEVYKGLEDISYIYEHIFEEPEKAAFYAQKANLVKKAIIRNYSNNNEFYVYKDLKGYKKVDWDVWYPDSVSQVYPVVFGVVKATDSEATFSYKKIGRNWDWANLKASEDYPWVLMGYVGAMLSTDKLPEKFYEKIDSQYLQQEDIDKWNSLESAWFIYFTHTLGMTK